MVYRNINSSFEMTLDKNWLSNTIFKLIENKSKECNLINIEHIIKPVINMFNDYKGKFCLSIILGYGYNHNCSDKPLFDELIRLNTELYKNIILLLRNEYGISQIYCFGDCPDSSFAEYDRKMSLGTNSITFNIGDTVTDEYFWNVINLGTFALDKPDSSIVYSIFPKESITLSRKKNLKIDIDPFKLIK